MRITVVIPKFDDANRLWLTRELAMYSANVIWQEDTAIVSASGDVTTLMCVVAVCDKYS